MSFGLVAGQALRLVAIGLTAGLVLAAVMSGWTTGLLFEVGSRDLSIF